MIIILYPKKQGEEEQEDNLDQKNWIWKYTAKMYMSFPLDSKPL